MKRIRLECELFALRWTKEKEKTAEQFTDHQWNQAKSKFVILNHKKHILKKYINQLIHIFFPARCNH